MWRRKNGYWFLASLATCHLCQGKEAEPTEQLKAKASLIRKYLSLQHIIPRMDRKAQKHHIHPNIQPPRT